MDRNHQASKGRGAGRVALLAEGVDRNIRKLYRQLKKAVALLAEGVDRNRRYYAIYDKVAKSPSSRRAWIEICRPLLFGNLCCVALLAEGVDRNEASLFGKKKDPMSPSSRRAWIEIFFNVLSNSRVEVALLAEGVDRNYFMNKTTRCMPGRPPRGGRG